MLAWQSLRLWNVGEWSAQDVEDDSSRWLLDGARPGDWPRQHFGVGNSARGEMNLIRQPGHRPVFEIGILMLFLIKMTSIYGLSFSRLFACVYFLCLVVVE